MLFIVRLFPEITIKSLPVRKRWTKILTENIRVLSRRVHPKSKVSLDWDRILVRLDHEHVPREQDDCDRLRETYMQMLASTPGISNFSYVREHPFESVDDICQLAIEAWQDSIDDLFFCVRVRRVGKQIFSSMDVERAVGSALNVLGRAKGVKLKKPDVTLSLEIKDERCYLVEAKHEGLGGFPMGTQESVLSLVSGGFDSTLASQMMIQRGLRTHFLFFSLGGREHEVAVKELAFYLWNKYASTHRIRFITVPFEKVVEDIVEHVDASNMGVVLKRAMVRAANVVARKGGIQALVTGEAIAQVSSQTLNNLRIIEDVSDHLILRPLITMSKPEIIKRCRDIGAEEFSAAIPEYCGAISVKPSAKVKAHELIEQEQLCSDEVFEQALADCRVQMIDEVMGMSQEEDQNNVSSIEQCVNLLPNDCVIDIRHPDEIAVRKLLNVDETQYIQIPFYHLNTKFKSLEKNRRYLLYCDRGVMSQLHALHLSDEGEANVAVYRPNVS